jgi:alkylated DNA repair dioxygenase AlkB
MAQLAFFGNERRTLLDDATGAITYLPALVDDKTSAGWCEALMRDVPWRSERRRMYDRDVDVPRLVGAYRLDDAAIPRAVTEAAQLIRSASGNVAFTNVGLNLYRDGRDSVAPHNDHLYEIVAGYPIALLSLGATRRMTIRSKQRPRRILDLDLEGGSLLLMSYETQKHYDHGIPKVREPIGPRISLAFRVRPQ